MNRFQSTKWFRFHIKVPSWYWADCFGSKNLRPGHSLLCDIFQMCVRLLNSHYEERSTGERDNGIKRHEIWELDGTFRHDKLNCERGYRGIVKLPVYLKDLCGCHDFMQEFETCSHGRAHTHGQICHIQATQKEAGCSLHELMCGRLNIKWLILLSATFASSCS